MLPPLKLANESEVAIKPPARTDSGVGSSLAFAQGQLRDSVFLQPVADHVGLISQINPRRQSAAESRRQFGASTPNMNMRGAVILVYCCRSISAEILGEIDRGFLDINQGLGRSPFGVNHVMAFEFDVEEFEFVVFTRVIAGDGRAVD